MTTVANIVSSARVLLNDESSVRYTDSQMVGYVNEAYKLVRRIRPDLFFGAYQTTLPTLVSGDNFPFDPQYEPAFVDYLVGRAESRDDDYAVNGRATMLLQSFRAGMGA